MKKEADFQTKFGRWSKFNNVPTGAYELKLSKKSSMPFSAVAEHQLMSLQAVKHNQFYFKIPDATYCKLPFDCFIFNSQYLGAPKAMVVICYYLNRGDKEFFMIDIDVFIKEKETSERKSLTLERCREIGTRYELGTTRTSANT